MIFHIHALNRDDHHIHDHIFFHEMMNDPLHDTAVPALQMVAELLKEAFVL